MVRFLLTPSGGGAGVTASGANVLTGTNTFRNIAGLTLDYNDGAGTLGAGELSLQKLYRAWSPLGQPMQVFQVGDSALGGSNSLILQSGGTSVPGSGGGLLIKPDSHGFSLTSFTGGVARAASIDFVDGVISIGGSVDLSGATVSGLSGYLSLTGDHTILGNNTVVGGAFTIGSAGTLIIGFDGFVQLASGAELNAAAGSTVGMANATSVTVPTVATATDSTTKAASTAFVQAALVAVRQALPQRSAYDGTVPAGELAAITYYFGSRVSSAGIITTADATTGAPPTTANADFGGVLVLTPNTGAVNRWTEGRSIFGYDGAALAYTRRIAKSSVRPWLLRSVLRCEQFGGAATASTTAYLLFGHLNPINTGVGQFNPTASGQMVVGGVGFKVELLKTGVATGNYLVTPVYMVSGTQQSGAAFAPIPWTPNDGDLELVAQGEGMQTHFGYVVRDAAGVPVYQHGSTVAAEPGSVAGWITPSIALQAAHTVISGTTNAVWVWDKVQTVLYH